MISCTGMKRLTDASCVTTAALNATHGIIILTGRKVEVCFRSMPAVKEDIKDVPLHSYGNACELGCI